MRHVLSFVALLLSVVSYSRNIDTSVLNIEGNKYYLISRQENDGVIVFLHGGVRNPAFAANQPLPTLAFLLEENPYFVPAALNSGMNVLIPVKNDSMDWIADHEHCFRSLCKVLQQKNYKRRFISGFSDGGTGSYRIFYSHADYFDGVVVCNGYPQLQNFNKTVKYDRVADRKVLFLATTSDKTIPYEFLLIEYALQKKYNPDTYIYLAQGGHSFASYKDEDMHELFEMLTTLPDNKENSPVHAYSRRDSIIHFYRFRKSTLRKYNYGRDCYEENLRQSARSEKD
ncbi:MAG: hypothetical protein KF744_10910 [Taibaiella sp.]|nr:hypothetical protein [Taibaiella sp.]